MSILILILTIIASALTICLLLYAAWLLVLLAIGTVSKKKEYPESESKHFAVMICARNEEAVIGQLVDSLMAQNYPKDCFKVFVVAHNCDDHTADVAREHGAVAVERIAPEERNKVYALKHGLDHVKKEYGDFFDYFAVFDADAVVSPDFLRKINDGLVSEDADCAAGYYASKNFEDSVVSGLSGTLYYSVMGNSCSHNALSLPVNVYGSGYAAKMKWMDELDDVTTIVDDFEFSTRLVLKKAKMIMVPDAVFYAEMPTDLKEALRQRKRWAMGDSQAYRKYEGTLRRAIPSLGMAGFKQYMDLILNPISLVSAIGIVCWIAVWILSGVLYGFNFWPLLPIGIGLLVLYLGMAGGVLGTLSKEKISIAHNLPTVLLFPFWVLVSWYYAVVTMFMKTVEWIPTKHVKGKTIDEISGKQ